MSNEKKTGGKALYSLIPLDSFKALLGVDDREDKLCRFSLTTSTFTIEQYCMRRFLRKKYVETVEYYGDKFLPLREYPVISINSEQVTVNNGDILDPKYYRVIPDCGSNENFQYSVEFSKELRKWRWLQSIKFVYEAGYSCEDVPQDLASACLELAAWNMSRYKGKRIGVITSTKADGLEMAMPLQVRELLEPYRRKTI